MDLSLGFTSPARRNSKIEMSLPYFKNNSYESNVLPIDSPKTMFGSTEGCSIARIVIPTYNSNCSYLPKSFSSNYFNFTKGNASVQKVMVPKVPSYISISQQTIVGGFVGSKSHAGRSFFGESSQLWDAVVCKFVELMSLAKDKAPESKLSSNGKSLKTYNTCHSNASTLNTGVTNRIQSNCKAESNNCEPSIETGKSGIYSGNQANIDDRPSSKNISSCVPSYVSNPVKPEKLEVASTNCKEDMVQPRRETYSSVVDRTLKSKSSVPSNSCLPNKSITQELSIENCKSNVTTPQRQSYADVAKSIPHKYLENRKKVGCEMILNFKKRILNGNTGNDKKEYRRSPAKKAKHVNTSKKSTTDDVILNRDSRWSPYFKSKRVRFQKSHPVDTPSASFGPECSEDLMCVSEDVCAKESDSVFESDNGKPISLCEIVRPEPVKGGMRCRRPSECSLDSEDSFVVFEDYPDCASSSSPCLSMEQISSLEEEEFDDDNESYTSSDDSDSEDDFVDFGEISHSSPVASIKLKRANCKWIKDVTAYTVPERKSKVQQKKKVHFAEGCHLAVVRPMIAWGYAYRESRRGPWEEHARDRFRFRCRIESTAPLLNMILEPNHRRKIYESRFSDN